MGQESSHEQIDDTVLPRTLQSRSISSVANFIKDGKASRIVVLTGAGISTSAGIPDFRSPDTGLYANLARLDLPYAEAVFDISYFRNNPAPFYALAKELYPGKYKPTVAHAFIALLAKKGLLWMLFTQNIDCLERVAGVPSEKIVEAHGSFATQRCIECGTEFPGDLMKRAVESEEVPHCIVPQCNGLVKPDIVFFGEQLPERFFANRHAPAQASLMLILGTSLTVQPFANLPDLALEGVPRVLFNMERVGSLGSRADDVCVLGDCDTGIRKLADALGWREELELLWEEVSGGGKEAADVESAKELKSKDELLEEEIEKLTGEVDRALKVSSNHKEYLEKHLQSKSASGLVETTNTAEEKIVEAKAETTTSGSGSAEIDAAPKPSESSPAVIAHEEKAAETTPTDLQPSPSPNETQEDELKVENKVSTSHI